MAHNNDLSALGQQRLGRAPDHVCVVEHGGGRERHALYGRGEAQGDGGEAAGAQVGEGGGVDGGWGEGAGDEEDGWGGGHVGWVGLGMGWLLGGMGMKVFFFGGCFASASDFLLVFILVLDGSVFLHNRLCFVMHFSRPTMVRPSAYGTMSGRTCAVG
tara:strand:- start:1004 stop:1477 length:474 start_codon:yes stop_codon:yes gene_type:complete